MPIWDEMPTISNIAFGGFLEIMEKKQFLSNQIKISPKEFFYYSPVHVIFHVKIWKK